MGQYFGKMAGVGKRSSMLIHRDVFLAGYADLRPTLRDGRGQPGRADAFDDQVGLKTNLDAAAAQRRLAILS